MSKYVQSKYASFYYRALLWTTRIAMCSDKNLHKIWSSQIVPQMIFIKVHSIKRVVFLSLKKLALLKKLVNQVVKAKQRLQVAKVT